MTEGIWKNSLTGLWVCCILKEDKLLFETYDTFDLALKEYIRLNEETIKDN